MSMPAITLINDAIVGIKLKSYYQAYVRNEHAKAHAIIKELFYIMNNHKENDMNNKTYSKGYDMVALACLHTGLRRYSESQRLCREALYEIENTYIPVNSGMVLV